MIPRLVIDTAEMPDGGGEIRLVQRGSEYSIMLGSTELMNSRLSGSEEALAALSCAKIADRRRPHMLIGGLGMGFTLGAALEELPADAEVTVAELVPSVVEWARGPLAHLCGPSLADPRVSILEIDVATLIAGPPARFDAILLDVDNGPDGLTREANDRLYDRAGLRRAKTALRPGGVLAIWSSAPDVAFANRLRKAGFEVEEVRVRAHKSRGAHHLVWTAVKPGG